MTQGENRATQYWIAVVAEDRARRAREAGYAELNHGRAGMLELLQPGDGYITYSPRATEPKGAPVQAFTSIGHVGEGGLHRAEQPDGSSAFRLPVLYLPAQPAPIRPLIESLAFIRNPQHWGSAFRFGALRIAAVDFGRIAAAMGHAIAEEPARAA
ncbi:MAG: EVE domain-containing protein [Pseudomonadota bacterium]|nr:EVE domain-containing protein [Pseudomonadota bacterium]